MIEMMVYTIAGILLYIASDWILAQIESAREQQFENRNMVFFGIIMTLSLAAFTIIRLLLTDM